MFSLSHNSYVYIHVHTRQTIAMCIYTYISLLVSLGENAKTYLSTLLPLSWKHQLTLVYVCVCECVCVCVEAEIENCEVTRVNDL